MLAQSRHPDITRQAAGVWGRRGEEAGCSEGGGGGGGGGGRGVGAGYSVGEGAGAVFYRTESQDPQPCLCSGMHTQGGLPLSRAF